MARRGENIYKRKDGRYEGRYVIGRTAQGRTKFGYVYGRQYHTVRSLLMEKKAAQQRADAETGGSPMHLAAWMERWLEWEQRGRVRESSYQTYLNLYRRHIVGIFLFTLKLLNYTVRHYKNHTQYKLMLSWSVLFQTFVILYSLTGLPHYDFEVNYIYYISMSVPFMVYSTGDFSGVKMRRIALKWHMIK